MDQTSTILSADMGFIHTALKLSFSMHRKK